jgi:hypothetical protein
MELLKRKMKDCAKGQRVIGRTIAARLDNRGRMSPHEFDLLPGSRRRLARATRSGLWQSRWRSRRFCSSPDSLYRDNLLAENR